MEDRMRYNAISIYRQYHSIKDEKYFTVPDDAFSFYQQNNINLLSLLNLKDEGMHYTQEIKVYFAKNGTQKYAMLDIWDVEWCQRNGIDIPNRTVIQKIVMWYLEKSNPYQHSLIVRAIDYVLKKIYK